MWRLAVPASHRAWSPRRGSTPTYQTEGPLRGTRGHCPLNYKGFLEKMNRNNRQAGFTLIELMIVVAIIAIIAAVAIPKLVSARISANENAAIATLRSIAAAQQQLQASAAIDTDADGGGEHGYFGELAGADFVREFNAGAAQISNILLDPTYLSTQFGNVVPAPGGGVVERQGYFYMMFLPGAEPARPISFIAEAPAGGNPGALPGGSNAEIMWCCYCWPVQRTKTGNRAFFINQAGDVLATLNNVPATSYNGITVVPDPDAVFTVALDMGSQPGIGALIANGGLPAQDGVWTPVGN